MSRPRTESKTRVAVLGGGPDAEREVSLNSARAIAEALASADGCSITSHEIGRITARELKGIDADIIFPVLHGAFGEGGPLQDLLEADGRPYVGSGPDASRLAMDKLGTKLVGAAHGVPTAGACVFDVRDEHSWIGLPAVLKPVHEGSSVGVHLCRTRAQWDAARAAVAADMRELPGRVYMVERLVEGAELTVGVFDPGGAQERSLHPIRIEPAAGFYDYEAKYTRDDTRYTVDPDLPAETRQALSVRAVAMARALGVRHLCRVDFLLDARNDLWLLEVNTMPGFTSHSLFPMAARHAGTAMPELCAALVDLARRDGPTRSRLEKKA